MFSIQWAKKALKQLVRFPADDKKRISEAVDELASWPKCRNVKALRNQPFPYRLRVGRYRVFFEVKTGIRVILIEEVKKRDERTY
ncbi:MAG: type II toxin-antitoxin system RelE family toxin [Desulfococcaceae bacterium]